jgi:hypothetical protein
MEGIGIRGTRCGLTGIPGQPLSGDELILFRSRKQMQLKDLRAFMEDGLEVFRVFTR